MGSGPYSDIPLRRLAGFQPFTCIICEKEITLRYVYDWREYPVPPVCTTCRNAYRPSRIRSDCAGSFRDRKVLETVGALAEALSVEAYRFEDGHLWGGRYAVTRLPSDTNV